ncbi:uncharacterized protein LOC135711686 isoform X2 [Ochlerotatus camptorhynchus]|uniref:uncharacterized protein LOC135711686 isoform X2 n=1 Tax=Ochlerotatus camptorhynchus TaxID=644619 RepID=UPI0031DF7F74
MERESCTDSYAAQKNRQHSKRRSSALSQDEIFDKKYKAAIEAYQNYMEGFQLMLAENERKMNKILDRRSVPLWFQELSDRQVVVMNLLLEAIRDDLDEDSVFRCRELIGGLGVYPLCPPKIFREALVMSRGNDLSFLWFLLELHYSRKRRQNYTNNERLLMSAICHLDMMTTLRGLERILPPPAPQKPCRPKRSSESLGWPTSADHYCSPYLEPQRVREPCLKSFSNKTFQPNVPFCLNRYKQYRNTDFVIPNEASRWFAKRVRANQTDATKDGEEEQDEMMQRKIPLSTSACDSAELIVRELLTDQIALMVGREQERMELCRKHQDMERRRKKLMGLLTKRTDVREKLNEEVAKVRDERKLAEQTARDNQMIQLLLRKLIDDSIVSCMLTPRSDCPECWESFERQRMLLDGTKCSCDKEQGIFCLRSMLAINRKQKPMQKYFRCCRGAVPFEFDYRKILEDDTERPVCPVKKAIRVALGMEQGNVDETGAVARCMKEMWRCELKLWNERFLKGRDEAREKKTEIDVLDFEYVDSKDPTFLQQLLKRALLKLCEDPKYVLATFPDAHELPFLNAWIQHRYGATRSKKERDELLRESKYFWDWLIPRATAMRWPVCKDLGMHGRVNWNYKQRLERNAQTLLAKFYRQFKRLQLQENRLYWSTMDPYRTNVDRFRQVFFDYLPNCEALIGPMVRPWQPFEFRPMESLSRTLKVCDSRTKWC